MYYDGVVNRKKTRRGYGIGLLLPKEPTDIRVEFRLTKEEQVKFMTLLKGARVTKQRFLRGLVLELISSAEGQDVSAEV
jgi:hypothetical protein